MSTRRHLECDSASGRHYHETAKWIATTRLKNHFEVQEGGPPGLKPAFWAASCGTAEAVPFPKPGWRWSFSAGCEGVPLPKPIIETSSRIRQAFAMGVLVLSVCLGFVAETSAQTAEESQVKAAYLYNFAKFVEWPAGMFRDPDAPAVICVVGDERTSDVLERAVAGKKVSGRPMEARRPRSAAEFRSCHILFIGFSDKERIARVLNGLQGSSVLTVGQSGQFIPLGGMINLALKDATIGLEIDPEASNAAGLKISSRLLVVARLVKSRRGAGGER